MAYVHGNLVNAFRQPGRGGAGKCLRCNSHHRQRWCLRYGSPGNLYFLGGKQNQLRYGHSRAFRFLQQGSSTCSPTWVMGFNPDMNVVSAGDKVASRIIDASTGGLLPDAPDDAGFALSQLYESLKDEFWIDYRIIDPLRMLPVQRFGSHHSSRHASQVRGGEPGAQDLRSAHEPCQRGPVRCDHPRPHRQRFRHCAAPYTPPRFAWSTSIPEL